jgi:DNA polymerase III delta prime subunit
MSFDFSPNNPLPVLKTDLMSAWITEHWVPKQERDDYIIVITAEICTNTMMLTKFTDDIKLAKTFVFKGYSPVDNPDFVPVFSNNYQGELLTQTGTYCYHFEEENGEAFDVLIMSAYYSDDQEIAVVACVPKAYLKAWGAFTQTCQRLAYPESKVIVIGGNTNSFEPKVDWDEIILPTDLKDEILRDVEAFFERGVDIYKRLNLNPFRKLLFAGVPGTGKSMLCNALAKRIIEKDHQAIYISSADSDGSSFWKIQRALYVAADSQKPTLIILEELDAYLSNDEKALILNVLDGSESFENEAGTLLISTTNYPEAIDERVMKRPGRLDRIFIIPETRTVGDAELMLKKYVGEMWRDEHIAVAEKLVGYPGAFIREVAIYSLTQLVNEEANELTVERLNSSFNRLRNQIEERDEFVMRRSMGYKL